MRTTLALDEDVYTFARAYAQPQHISIGGAISLLAREGISLQSAAVAKASKSQSKYTLLPARSEVITTQHVRELMDQKGI